jgi:hypothetical protein
VSSSRERLVGVIAFGLLTFALLFFLPNATGFHAFSRVIQYATHSPQRFPATDLSRTLQARDPVFLQTAGGDVVQAGYIEWVAPSATDRTVQVRWHHAQVDATQCQFATYVNRGRLEDAIALMFPPEKRTRIERLISNEMYRHGERITAQMTPFIEKSMRESLPVIEAGLKTSISKHRAEVDEIAGRWNDEIVQQRLVPLAKNEIVPIIRRHGEPVAQVIGQELWERASIWGFTWRTLYDKSPLPKKDLMKREWDRFVQEEAIPVLESHTNDIVGAVQKTMLEVAENAEIRQEISAAADSIASDEKARALVQTVLREAILENVELRNVWRDVWTSDDAKQVLEEAGRTIEPLIRQIGDELMGTPEQGIEPGFARLLRNQILQKDARWVIATPVTDGSVWEKSATISVGQGHAVFPMPIYASPQ